MDSFWHRSLMIQRQNKRFDGAPFGNDNAAKDHVSRAIRDAKSFKAFQRAFKGRLTSNISRSEYARVRTEVVNNYGPYEGFEGRICAIFVADRPAKLNEGNCYFFKNNGRMYAHPFCKIRLSEENKELINWLTERVSHN